MKYWEKYKTFKKKNIEDFSNSKFMQIVSLSWNKVLRQRNVRI